MLRMWILRAPREQKYLFMMESRLKDNIQHGFWRARVLENEVSGPSGILPVVEALALRVQVPNYKVSTPNHNYGS